MFTIRQTVPEDFLEFTPHEDDLNEALAAGIKPEFPHHEECVSMVNFRDKALAIGGNTGDQVWFVTSQSVAWLSIEERTEFRKCIVGYRDKLLKMYPTLWNFVWVGNKSHIRFLKSIGAVFHNEYTNDGTFQLFTIGGALCAGNK